MASPACGQPRCARARETRSCQAASSAASTSSPTVSSWAPVVAKNRLAPVRRREASNGSSLMARSVFGLRGNSHAALIADEALETELRSCRLTRLVPLGHKPRIGYEAGRGLGRRSGGTCRLELGDLLPGAHQRIGEYQQQIALLSHVQRRVDRFLLIG